jgi:hypothetical protein
MCVRYKLSSRSSWGRRIYQTDREDFPQQRERERGTVRELVAASVVEQEDT